MSLCANSAIWLSERVVRLGLDSARVNQTDLLQMSF